MDGFFKILGEALGKIFQDILGPILEAFLQSMFKSLLQALKKALGWLFYYIFTALLKLISTLNNMFEFFAGSSNGMVEVEGIEGKTTVLEAMFSMQPVKYLFIALTIVCLGFSFIFTIISVIKSMSDMTMDSQNPLSKILSNSLKSFISFAIIPILCIFLLQLSSVILNTIETAYKESSYANGGSTTIDRIIWNNCSINASKTASFNINNYDESKQLSKSQSDTIEKIKAGTDSYRYEYVYGNSDYSYSAVSGSSTFQDRFDYCEFDYIQGIISAILLVLIYAACIGIFIARIFELIVLYIIGPVFAASIAYDGGEMFKKWKEMFVAKFIGSYSVIIGMRLYVIIIPAVCAGSIKFSTSTGLGFTSLYDSVFKILMIVGGAYTVYKSQTMILRLLSIEAATSAEGNGGAASGIAGSGMRFAAGAIGLNALLAPFKLAGSQGKRSEMRRLDENSSSSGNGFSGANNAYRDGHG